MFAFALWIIEEIICIVDFVSCHFRDAELREVRQRGGVVGLQQERLPVAGRRLIGPAEQVKDRP